MKSHKTREFKVLSSVDDKFLLRAHSHHWKQSRVVDSHLKRGELTRRGRELLNAKLDDCCAVNAFQSGLLCLIVWDKDYSGLLLFEAWASKDLQLFEVDAHICACPTF